MYSVVERQGSIQWQVITTPGLTFRPDDEMMFDIVVLYDTAYPRYSDVGIMVMWLKQLTLLVEGDSDPAHYGIRRAPERVSLHHYHSNISSR